MNDNTQCDLGCENTGTVTIPLPAFAILIKTVRFARDAIAHAWWAEETVSAEFLGVAERHGLHEKRLPTLEELSDPHWWGKDIGLTGCEEIGALTPEFALLVALVDGQTAAQSQSESAFSTEQEQQIN